MWGVLTGARSTSITRDFDTRLEEAFSGGLRSGRVVTVRRDPRFAQKVSENMILEVLATQPTGGLKRESLEELVSRSVRGIGRTAIRRALRGLARKGFIEEALPGMTLSTDTEQRPFLVDILNPEHVGRLKETDLDDLPLRDTITKWRQLTAEKYGKWGEGGP